MATTARRVAALIALVACVAGPAGARPATAAGPAAGAPSPAYAEALRTRLEAEMGRLGPPGALVYVSVPGRGAWSAALGTGDLATGAPATLADHFRIGSITKTFTGTVVLQLVDAGRL